SKAEFKKYLNDRAQEVKKTNDPQEKREILDNMFHKLLEAAEYAENWPLFSDNDKAGISELKNKIELKHDELNGYNNFNRLTIPVLTGLQITQFRNLSRLLNT